MAPALRFPKAGSADDHAFEKREYPIITQISTDGFAGYREAVDMAFGPFAKYGQIIKEYRNAKMVYTPSEMIGTRRKSIRNIEENEKRTICTSHVERHNLTIRTFMKRFARLSLGFSKKLENLESAVALFMAYYNFVWRTRHSDNSGKSGSLRPTAAMMAGVVNRLWKVEDLYEEILKFELVEA